MSRTHVHWVIAIAVFQVTLSAHAADAGGKLHRKPIMINRGVGHASPNVFQAQVNNETSRTVHAGGGLRVRPRKLKLR
jgi:hypothetical protein